MPGCAVPARRWSCPAGRESTSAPSALASGSARAASRTTPFTRPPSFTSNRRRRRERMGAQHQQHRPRRHDRRIEIAALPGRLEQLVEIEPARPVVGVERRLLVDQRGVRLEIAWAGASSSALMCASAPARALSSHERSPVSRYIASASCQVPPPVSVSRLRRRGLPKRRSASRRNATDLPPVIAHRARPARRSPRTARAGSATGSDR